MKTYLHPGWTGVPYESDFMAQWGLVRRDHMLDCTDLSHLNDAALRARDGGFGYLIFSKPSAAGNRLFKVSGKRKPLCVYALLEYQKRNAEKGKARYRDDLDERIRQSIRVAKNRASAKNMPFDLDVDDIIRRVRLGRCEATGLDLALDMVWNNDRRNPFLPSLDQRVPSAGYTNENVMVVCLGWNLMRSNFSDEDFGRFVAGLREASLRGGFQFTQSITV